MVANLRLPEDDWRLEGKECSCDGKPVGPKDWGVPDWRSEIGYQVIIEMPLIHCRWEFFRRRHDYRREFWAHSFQSKDYCPDDPLDVRSLHTGADIPDCEQRFGIDHCPNPALRTVPTIAWLFIKTTVTALDNENYGAYDRDPDDEEYESDEPTIRPPSALPTFVEIDLAKSIRSQLEEIETPLLELQRRALHGRNPQPRLHLEKWPIYLGALDAKDAGATYSEILKTVLRHKRNSDSKAIREVLLSAKRLQFKWPY